MKKICLIIFISLMLLPTTSFVSASSTTFTFGGKLTVIDEIWGNWSSWWTFDYDPNIVDPPYNGVSTYTPEYNTINLTWTKGNHSNQEIVICKSGSYPSTYTDGIVYQNSTHTYYNFTVNSSSGYFTIWSYNTSSGYHSSTGLNIPWGAIGISCFNESKPSQSLTFNLEISNQAGSIVYKRTGLTGTHYVDANNIPYGSNTVFIVESTGYKQRIYYKDISLSSFYNFSFYLPPSITSLEPTDDVTGCSLRSFINSINISNPDVDAVITLSYTVDTIIGVEIYNNSLYGTYGGWLFITENKYIVGSDNVTINQTALDDNTIMARVTYYYIYCPTEIIDTPLYYLRVVETTETEYSSYDKGVADAKVTIKRYANTTGTYVDVASLLTDANGYCNVYLLPNTLYKVNITKSGYTFSMSDYIPAPANQYGQTAEKIFRIILTEETGWVVNLETLFTNITYSFEPLGSRHYEPYTFYYNITSSDGKLQWYRMNVKYYNESNNTWVLLSSQNETNAYGGSINYTIPNMTGKYEYQCFFKKTGYPEYEFGEIGSIIQFYVYLRAGIQGIPDYVWFLITIIIMIVVMGYCILHFNTGITTGYVGLGVFGIMLLLKPFSVPLGGDFGDISGWIVFGLTFCMYTAGIFLWSKI